MQGERMTTSWKSKFERLEVRFNGVCRDRDHLRLERDAAFHQRDEARREVKRLRRQLQGQEPARLPLEGVA